MAALHLSAENFKQEVLEAKGKVLVDFFAKNLTYNIKKHGCH